MLVFSHPPLTCPRTRMRVALQSGHAQVGVKGWAGYRRVLLGVVEEEWCGGGPLLADALAASRASKRSRTAVAKSFVEAHLLLL